MDGMAPLRDALPRGARLSVGCSPRCPAGRDGGKGGADPGLIPLTVPEVRRLVLAMAGPDDRRSFRLDWSRWRRAHQAVAARCHAARRALRQGVACPVSAALPRAAVSGELSDAEWERVRPLLPPQKPTTGRPRHDHRTVLNGILSVTRTDASWREIPTECGKWETAYKRYRLWCDIGLWQHILTALADQAHEVSL